MWGWNTGEETTPGQKPGRASRYGGTGIRGQRSGTKQGAIQKVGRRPCGAKQITENTHTHARWEPRDKNKARKAVERKLLRNSRAVLDVFRSGEDDRDGSIFSAGQNK